MPHITNHIAVVLCLIALLAQSASACELNVRWNEDAPYTFFADDKVQGIDADTIDAVLSKLGCQSKYVEAPWARALLMLEQGKVDIVSGAFKTPEREKFAYFSKVPSDSNNLLFLRAADKETWRLEKLTELTTSSFKLGAQIDVHYGPDYETLIASPEFKDNLVFQSNRKSLWKMLSLGRIDGLIADEITGKLEIKELGLKQDIYMTDIIVSTEPAFIMFSKHSPSINADFLERFDKAYLELVESGGVEAIKSRYLD